MNLDQPCPQAPNENMADSGKDGADKCSVHTEGKLEVETDTFDAEICSARDTLALRVGKSTGQIQQPVHLEESTSGGKEPKEETTSAGEKKHDEEEKSHEDEPDKIKLSSLFK